MTSAVKFDRTSGRYFMSTIELVQQVENKINKQFIDKGFVSLSDLHEHMYRPMVDASAEN